MKRVRISTTVDGSRLATCRRLLPGHDSSLLDEALGALIEKIEARLEQDALSAQPYESDPDLAWTAPSGPDLPYDGDVPPEVLDIAKRRREAR